MSASLLQQLLAALTTKEGAIIATPILLGLAGIMTLNGSPSVAPAAVAPVAKVAQATASVVSAATPTGPTSFTPAQRAEIEGMIKNYLLNNPEVLVEVSKELEKRQASLQAESHRKVIVDNKTAIFQSPTDFSVGNPKGPISVVEFFDYNCGWCKKAVDEVNKLTKADPNVRVVLKELPIFGENSALAAKAAMASIKQGKYWDFHVALMREKQVTKDNLFQIAAKVGLNVDKLKTDMADPAYDAALKANMTLAQELGIEGTPGFIIDSRVNVGFVPAEGIREILADIRKTGCQAC